MPPRTPQSYNQPGVPGATGDFDLPPDGRQSELERIRMEAVAAYDNISEEPQLKDMSPLGAAAYETSTPLAGLPAEYAIDYEPIELTLEQLGHNIERMRIYAVQKHVNPAVPSKFIARLPNRLSVSQPPASVDAQQSDFGLAS